MGQDWSEIWLQRFSGTITIWPKSVPSDFVHILTDPTPKRLARMIHIGQLSTWPKLNFIGNRMKIERLIEEGRRATRPGWTADGGLANILSEDDIKGLLREAKSNNGTIAPQSFAATPSGDSESEGLHMSPSKSVRRRERDKPLPKTPEIPTTPRPESPSISSKITGWWNRSRTSIGERPNSMYELRPKAKSAVYQQVSSPQPEPHDLYGHYRRGSLVDELSRQSQVFFDDEDFDKEEATGTESEGAVEETDDEGEMDVSRRYDGIGDEEQGDVEGSEVEDNGWEEEVDNEKIGDLSGTRREDEEVEKENLGPTVVG
jgi:hypothetical protein